MISFGLFSMWDGKVPQPNTDMFSMFYGQTSPSTLPAQIAAVKKRGAKLVTSLAGGARSNYKTDGKFDMKKWQARIQQYNTATMRKLVDDAVAAGVLIANILIDEPFNTGGPGNQANSWGPEGTITKAMVDQMCAYQRNIFPTLPGGPFHSPKDFDTAHQYHVTDFIVPQYRYSKGTLLTWRDDCLAFGRRENVAIAFGTNVIDGGLKIDGCPKPKTGGAGSYGTNCRMTPDQVRETGLALGKAAGFLTGFKYDPDMAKNAAYAQAFRDVRDGLHGLTPPPLSLR